MPLHDRYPILIVGGGGAFGARLAELLARAPGIDLVLAGRRLAPLDMHAAALFATTGRPVRAVALDARGATADDIARLGVRTVINASGPFQTGSYDLAKAAIGAGCHYIDLADARAFVTGFSELDAAARAAGVLAVSGASSVPGLSSAVVAHYAGTFASVDEIDIAISPGNAFDPGVATVSSVLGGVGQPIHVLDGGAWKTVYGWQGLRRGSFGRAGRRWLGYVDVPDLELLPEQIHTARTVRFQAGLEVSFFHLGLWAASWLVRSGVVRSLAPLAPGLLAVKRRLSRLGTDRGGMVVALRGIGHDGAPKELTWLLEALNGHGPYVPALTSAALARRLASGAETRTGAFACQAIVPLAAILAEGKHLDILSAAQEKALPSRFT
ncbi:saccharopine dehydrogenase [Hyphomicrobium nitrativorans NL23]|uniref:Saccharopine dehydrogenase n=1 Tax=Hyphomicrobium nitrativorans NL23 TaxID=1029756 RepID=V5SB96_9HYPH|nr:saccharopine dehydrogenase NADP-binding domain-containing protein [Hyphomicrobium nitrativorans]AHB47244.1 saccharopine dehydrogenase [Hyphomicrobium nitrativorans NL23]